MPVAVTHERKALPHYTKTIVGRTVTGIFSVFGNMDDYSDRIWPGAFVKTIRERGKKVYHLWQHDMDEPAIAVIRSLREIGRDELTAEVLAEAPDALGGCEVVREYLDTERGNEILTGLQAGVPYQMSFAFDCVKFDEEPMPGARYDWERIRNIREVKLFEVSDVLWGANDATVSSKALYQMDFLLRQLQTSLVDIKEGRRNNVADQDRINTIATLAIELGANNVSLTPLTGSEPIDPMKASTPDAESRAAADIQAALTLPSTIATYEYRMQLAQRGLALASRRTS